MEKPSQLELFSQGRAAFEKKPAARPFLSYIRGYEKTIMVIIGCMVVGVIAYSFGVEKGKKASVAVAPQRAEQPAIKVEAPKQAAQESSSVSEDDFDGYTIQVASYKSRSSAEKEAQRLRAKGLSAIILSKGSWTILCVGNFPSKEKAKTSLTEFKKRYKDCIIRRL